MHSILYSHSTPRHPDSFPILVSRKDFERVSAYRWTPFQNDSDRRRGRVYFVSRVLESGGRYRQVYLHRFILSAPSGVVVDFKHSADTLDHRRSNLRFATLEQNAQNARKKCKNNHGSIPVSRFKGVCYDCERGLWKVRVQANGRRTTIGRFGLEIEAARAYDVAALKHHREYACLNFPIAA